MYMIHAVNMMRGTSNSFEVKASHTFHICTCQAVWIMHMWQHGPSKSIRLQSHTDRAIPSLFLPWVHAQAVKWSFGTCTLCVCVCLLLSVSSGANVTKILCLGDLHVDTWVITRKTADLSELAKNWLQYTNCWYGPRTSQIVRFVIAYWPHIQYMQVLANHVLSAHAHNEPSSIHVQKCTCTCTCR